jgi:DNA helicase-2/ATP-dependent DNA helicase PcrA
MIGAIDIADALGMPRPTDQQRLVIEAPLEPALVVAGAGSGKTETMANRVLWLLANGAVRPSEVLGLTFTRKAAAELAARIRRRMAELDASGLVDLRLDEFEVPMVATYNSFANTIYRDHAATIGRESDGSVLGEAAAWQLARRIVVRADDERMPDLGKNVDPITAGVLELSRAMAENVVDPEDVRSMAAQFASLAELPAGDRHERADMLQHMRTVGTLDVLLDLAVEFDRAKSLRGFVEYSDQVALALSIARRSPRVVTELRERHRVVLLDEYQDTSVVQTWLLSEVFGGTPVMAVGDPNQSIYGWRGASSANLEQFAEQFGGGAAQNFSLSTSWRNGHRILGIANRIVEPLESRVPVLPLSASPVASDEPVDLVVAETIDDEARACAEWLAARLRRRDPVTGQPPSAAMLFRARATQPRFLEALRDAGVPYHVLGVAGLLAEPEIADLVSALRVIHDPTAGSELVRVLAGSRWRLGVRDLHALRRVSSWLQDRDWAHRALEDDVRSLLRASVAEGEGGSIVDALDFVASAPDGHSQLEAFSPVGLERLRDAGRTFQRLRARSGLELLDFVSLVEQDFLLDIEVAANETRSLGSANREAFFDALTGYLAVDDTGSLGGFLSWLEEAQRRENLAARQEEPEPGTVQVLTIHSAKGLEWDLVVVPRMVADEMPSKPQNGNGWLAFGSLPWEFRGDADDLPQFAWRQLEDRKAFAAEHKRFRADVIAHLEREERRLAYVAVTRARHALLMSASFWSTQQKQRKPSPFLFELAEAGLVPAPPSASEAAENPLGDAATSFVWPLDPLGRRRSRVEAAAEAVRSALPGSAGPWQHEIDLLLAERAERSRASARVPLPSRVPASRFSDYVREPGLVAGALRRPMPERPYRATRLGTLFHTWVEQRYSLGGSGEELDSLVADLDEGAFVEEERLAELQATFERSPWANRRPVDVEREIHLVLAGQVIVCKIDAVYETAGRFEIVDWKTGRAPADAVDLEAKQYQLALYRLAYAKWRGVDPGLIDAVFYFVADDAIVRPEHIFSEAELAERWAAVAGPQRIAT